MAEEKLREFVFSAAVKLSDAAFVYGDRAFHVMAAIKFGQQTMTALLLDPLPSFKRRDHAIVWPART